MASAKRLARIEDASCLAFSGDGKSLAVGARNVITVLDVNNGETRFEFQEHQGRISTVVSSRDGTLFASGDGPHASSRDRPWLSILVWNSENGEIVSRIENREGATLQIDLDKANQRVAASFASKCLCAWYQGEVAERIGMFMVDGDPIGVEYIDNGAKIAYAHSYFDGLKDSYYVKVLDPLSGNQLMQIRQSAAISCFGVSPDERQFAVGRQDGVIDVWNTKSGDLLQSLSGPEHPVDTLAWANRGNDLVATHRQRGVEHAYFSFGVWDIESGNQMRAKHTEVENMICSTLSSDGQFLATISGYPMSVDLFDLNQMI